MRQTPWCLSAIILVKMGLRENTGIDPEQSASLDPQIGGGDGNSAGASVMRRALKSQMRFSARRTDWSEAQSAASLGKMAGCDFVSNPPTDL
jgi:hypothetical protein